MFGAALMAATLVTVLALNAASTGTHEHPVFWVTLPAATIMLCFDLTMGWLNRKETRNIAHEGRRRMEAALAEREEARRMSVAQQDADAITVQDAQASTLSDEKQPLPGTSSPAPSDRTREMAVNECVSDEEKRVEPSKKPVPTTLISLTQDAYTWAQETFPTTMTVFHHLPLALVPFAFCMFVLVQALVTKGWVPVFAHGWDHWVEKTGTVGAIGGMGFVSVILCNVSCHFLVRIQIYKRLTHIPVCRHKHRHHDSDFPRRPSMGGDSPPERNSDIRPNLLGHYLQVRLESVKHGLVQS